MTLNSIIRRIRQIAEAHKQVRRFKTGLAADFFADHTAKYPACCLQYTAASIADGALTINFRMFLVDLVHVADETKANEDDVLSDTLQVLMDLYAEMNNNNYSDWRISTSGTMEAIIEGGEDMYAGWFLDFTIRTPFTQNICAVPTEDIVED